MGVLLIYVSKSVLQLTVLEYLFLVTLVTKNECNPLKAQYLVSQYTTEQSAAVLRWLPCRGIGNYKSFKCG